MTVHQVLAVFTPNDAQFNHAIALRELLRRRWPDTHIYADHFPIAQMADEVNHYPWYADEAKPGDILVYHASTESPVNGWLLSRPERLVVIYHNVTPGEFFGPFDPVLTARQHLARKQIAALAPRTALAYGVSRYNADELAAWGFPDPQVMPLHVDTTRYRGPVDTRLLAALREAKGDGPGVLFTGRIVPNKAQHDLLRAHRVLLDRYPTAQLWCPGLPLLPSYVHAVSKYRSALGVPHGCFPGVVTQAQLLAFFQAADVFLSLSEHEGFNVPVIEAMACGLPVVAYGVASLPETVGGAGLLLDTNDPHVVAAAVERVFTDTALRVRMVEAGKARVERLDFEGHAERFLADLTALERESSTSA